ncbi:hypothetical protein [Actinomyces ruminis]|uniref:hypothetical protein n=1 Tax=Actinomyces ruminis TaxID=1937003 RepID=UPI003B8456A4
MSSSRSRRQRTHWPARWTSARPRTSTPLSRLVSSASTTSGLPSRAPIISAPRSAGAGVSRWMFLSDPTCWGRSMMSTTSPAVGAMAFLLDGLKSQGRTPKAAQANLLAGGRSSLAAALSTGTPGRAPS